MKTTEFDSAIAGVRYHKEQYLKAAVAKGDVLVLEAEPLNEYDSYAIKVLKGEMLLGYIPRTYNLAIHEAVTTTPEAVTCTVTFATSSVCAIRVRLAETEDSVQ